jgi:hypothetical protein
MPAGCLNSLLVSGIRMAHHAHPGIVAVSYTHLTLPTTPYV